jgi:hypothetical protein
MDLLGSILDSMDKPPSVSQKERERIKSTVLSLIISRRLLEERSNSNTISKFHFRSERGDVETTNEGKREVDSLQS